MKPNKTPDRFVLLGREWMNKLASHKNGFYAGIGVLVLIAIGVVAFQNIAGAREGHAWEAFYLAGKKPEAERWKAYREVYEKHSGQRAGYLAAVTVGDHEAAEARKLAVATSAATPKSPESPAAEAATWYGKALQYSRLTPDERGWLLTNRAEALNLQGKHDEAASELQKAVDTGPQAKAYAQVQLAQLEEDRGDTKKAIELYDKIAASGDNAFAKSAKGSIRRLKGTLFAETEQGKKP